MLLWLPCVGRRGDEIHGCTHARARVDAYLLHHCGCTGKLFVVLFIGKIRDFVALVHDSILVTVRTSRSDSVEGHGLGGEDLAWLGFKILGGSLLVLLEYGDSK